MVSFSKKIALHKSKINQKLCKNKLVSTLNYLKLIRHIHDTVKYNKDLRDRPINSQEEARKINLQAPKNLQSYSPIRVTSGL